MLSRKTRVSGWFLTLPTLIFFFSLAANAQIDPDPNSPQPILLTDEKFGRAISTESKSVDISSLSGMELVAHEPGSKITLFAANFDFLPGEGANAVRIYATDKLGRNYRFPVLAVDRIKGDDNYYAVTIQLEDEIRYWPAPERGDLKVYLTWRGLASNKVLLGLGETGGTHPDIDIIPMPSRQAGKTGAKQFLTDGPTSEYIGYRWSGDRMRFLEQATFGPTTALDAFVRRVGIRQYIGQQFEEPYPSASNPYPNQPLKPGNAPPDCDGNNTGLDGNPVDVPLTCNRDTYTQYQPQTWFLREAFYGEPQLRHRIAWALSQIWVTSGNDIQQGRHMVEWHKVLSNNAFGNYRTLMKQMTMNPTMGDYLDMVRSTKNNPNENYARELKQLFTIGLFQMNQDGTYQRDAQNNLIPTYDQNTVNNFTKVLTGWNFCGSTTAGVCPSLTVGTVNFIDPVLLNTNNHDLTAKTLLSYPGSATTNLAACPAPCTSVADRTTYANNSMDQALDNIFNHPNLGPYISRILIQQLVTSDPTPAYLGRVSAVFANNGNGVRGDLKAVVRAILLDPEARGDVKTDPNFGKLREPVLYMTNFARTFGVRGAGGVGTLSDGYLTGTGSFNGMGQVHFRAPTVFNYYPPDYVIPGTTLLGPEFAIMTTGTSIQRTNFIYRMLSNFTGTNPIPANTMPVPISTDTASSNYPLAPNGTSFDFSALQAMVVADRTNNRLLDELDYKMMHGTMSPAMRTSLQTALNSITLSTTPTEVQTIARVRQAIYLIATSSQYQVQR